MSKVVLDSSALLALINNESGATRVEELLGNIVMSSVNVAEVAPGRFVHERPSAEYCH